MLRNLTRPLSTHTPWRGSSRHQSPAGSGQLGAHCRPRRTWPTGSLRRSPRPGGEAAVITTPSTIADAAVEPQAHHNFGSVAQRLLLSAAVVLPPAATCLIIL